MTRKALIRLLKEYGDHKDRCAINKRIRAQLFDYRGNIPYPDCDCGWNKIKKEIIPD